MSKPRLWKQGASLIEYPIQGFEPTARLFVKLHTLTTVNRILLSEMYLISLTDIHMSVHRKYNSELQQTRRNVSWFIYFYRRSTCFRWFLRPSSGAHNCTYSFEYYQPILLLAAIVGYMELRSISCTLAASSSIGWQYLKLYVHFYAPDDGRRNRLKHVDRL